MKIAPWTAEFGGDLYHWCPACEELHVIPVKRWTRSGTDERPTFSPSFGQHLKRGYCHYNITDGQLFFHADSYHALRGAVPMPEIPETALEEIDGHVGVTTDAVFKRPLD